jgi:hypothetical protein
LQIGYSKQFIEGSRKNDLPGSLAVTLGQPEARLAVDADVGAERLEEIFRAALSQRKSFVPALEILCFSWQ